MKKDTKTTTSENRIRATPYRTSDRALCPLCEKPVKLLSFSDAADLFKTDIQEIGQMAQTRKLHPLHNRHGKIMICSESLFRIIN